LLKRAALLTTLALVVLGAMIAPLALAQGGPFLLADIRIPQSNDLKFPHVDTVDRTVFVSTNADESFARLVSKQDSAGSFGPARLMGAAEGDPRYTSAAIFTAPNGTIHYAWINAASRRILLRSKAPSDADFGPERLVTGSSPFPVEVEVAANEDGVFIFWREPAQPLKYRRSTDGVNWNTPTQTLETVQIEPSIEVAAAAGRRLAVSFTRGREDNLQGYMGIWNGSSFAVERIPTVVDRDFADPTMAFLPDGTLAVALRSTEAVDGFGAGVYVADRAPNGTWSQAARLIRGGTDFVAMDADPLGNIHLAWINKPSGNDLWYTTRRIGQGYGGTPLAVNVGDLPLFNVRGASNLSDRSYGHFVAERFAGDVPFGQYYGFGLPVNIVGAGSISIEAGQALTNKPTVSVSFAEVKGDPTEVRWRWGAPPSDAASDSGGFQPFSSATPLAVPLPALSDPNACTQLTLYTQLRAGSQVQEGTNSDSITLDRSVQSSFSVSSPDKRFDPSYTRVPTATVTVNSNLECAGLSAATVSGPISGGTLALDVAGKATLDVAVGLTGDPGAKTLTFAASDLLSNTVAVSSSVIYDPVPPVFTSAGTAIDPVPDPEGTTIVELALNGAEASDNFELYGIVVVPSVTPAGSTTPVVGQPIYVPFSQMNGVVVDPDTGLLSLRTPVNLADGLPASALVPGTYDLLIELVDAAGNVSESAADVVRSVTLTAVTYEVNLPIVR
jgi:hypothetical protein